MFIVQRRYEARVNIFCVLLRAKVLLWYALVYAYDDILRALLCIK